MWFTLKPQKNEIHSLNIQASFSVYYIFSGSSGVVSYNRKGASKTAQAIATAFGPLLLCVPWFHLSTNTFCISKVRLIRNGFINIFTWNYLPCMLSREGEESVP